jgi:hypothetical protein
MVSNKGEASVSKSRSDQKVAVNLASLEISAAELNAIPKSDAAFIASQEIAFNDIQFFLLLVNMSDNANRLTDDNVCRLYAAGRRLIALRNLCSRIYEIHVSVIAQHKIAERHRRTILDEEVIAEMAAHIADIRKVRFFSLMNWIRNGVTHHYAANRIAEVLGNFPDDHKFQIFLHKMDGNSFAPLAEEIAFFGHSLSWQDLQEFEKWLRELFKRCVKFRRDLLVALMKSKFPNKALKPMLIEVPAELVTELTETPLPIFATVDGELSGNGTADKCSTSD